MTSLLVAIFFLGYAAIIFEHYLKINKSGVALFIATVCWSLFFIDKEAHSDNLSLLGHHIADISQILFFLLGAMTLVELIDSHKGFRMVTDCIATRSPKVLLWIVTLITFFLSSILDNLTTTILMISILKKIIPNKEDRVLFSCLVVVAANAGGAWTPIGDVTTTMLWINGQISSLAIMKSLFLPSLISVLIPLIYYSLRMNNAQKLPTQPTKEHAEPRARAVFFLGVGGLVFVPLFKSLTGLPPFMGILLALGVLWIVTDLFHQDAEDRKHLQVAHVLQKIDTASILFFLGILLCVSSLQAVGFLNFLATWLSQTVGSLPVIAICLGFFSAVIDNVPLVAATMGMYPITTFPMDTPFWHMIAYTAGTGGSLLIIGSAAGVAMMGMEKMDFMTYLKKATFPTLLGFLAGMGAYLLF